MNTRITISVPNVQEGSRKIEMRTYDSPAYVGQSQFPMMGLGHAVEGNIEHYRPYPLTLGEAKDLMIGLAHAVAYVEQSQFPIYVVEIQDASS